jgi:hypothetical protein
VCDLYFDEQATVWNRSWRCAKKARQCECCRQVIGIGDRYEYTFAVFDGIGESHWACRHCARDIDAFGKEHRSYPFPSCFTDFLADCIDEGDEGVKRWEAMMNRIKKRRAAAPREAR